MEEIKIMNSIDMTQLHVVDVGASGGLCEPFSSETNIFAALFDPDMRAPLPKEEMQTYGRSVTFPTVLSQSPQLIRFHMAREQECSSCLEPNVEIVERYVNPERFYTERTLNLEARTLDTCMQAANIDPDFIKIDVQGFAYEVLIGAVHSINSACGLLLETEFEPLYKNQKLFPEIHELMRNKGFELFDLQRCFYKRRLLGRPEQKGQLVFGNALYLRPPEKLLAWRPEKFKAMMRLYKMFGYLDCYAVARELPGMDEFPAIPSRPEPTMTFARRKAYGLIWRLISVLQRTKESILWKEPFGSSDKPFTNL
jgi:FkbM family methyltransferase